MRAVVVHQAYDNPNPNPNPNQAYDNITLANDIALMKLASPVTCAEPSSPSYGAAMLVKLDSNPNPYSTQETNPKPNPKPNPNPNPNPDPTPNPDQVKLDGDGGEASLLSSTSTATTSGYTGAAAGPK